MSRKVIGRGTNQRRRSQRRVAGQNCLHVDTVADRQNYYSIIPNIFFPVGLVKIDLGLSSSVRGYITQARRCQNKAWNTSRGPSSASSHDSPPHSGTAGAEIWLLHSLLPPLDTSHSNTFALTVFLCWLCWARYAVPEGASGTERQDPVSTNIYKNIYADAKLCCKMFLWCKKR